jgi:hypothetical protein
MANRPRRSGAKQTFAVPNKDNIYNDSPALTAPLEEEVKPVEDTNNPSFPDNDINETSPPILTTLTATVTVFQL